MLQTTKYYSCPAESVWGWDQLALRGKEMSGHQTCYSEASNVPFASRAGVHSPLPISPPNLAPAALPLPLRVLAPISAPAPAEPPLPQRFPLPLPRATPHHPASPSLPWACSLPPFLFPEVSGFFSESPSIVFLTHEHGVCIFGTPMANPHFFFHQKAVQHRL